MYAQNPFGDLAHEVYVSCKTGDFIKAVSYFDDSLKSKMDAGQLSYMWGSVEEQMGKMKSLDMRLPWSESNDSLVIWFYPCDFEKKASDLKMVFNMNGMIVGFFLVPPSLKNTYRPPSWIPAGAVLEQEVTIPSAGFFLKGAFTVPANATKFPVVVFVQGSGPLDMDVTIGPNKFFKDLAMMLAANGIASVRYHKRTAAYNNELRMAIESMSPFDETVEDAVNVIGSVSQLKGVDPDNIFVLGHSFGGMMAPDIVFRSQHQKGIILMAANARPLPVLIKEQFRYLMENDSTNRITPALMQEVEQKCIEILNKNFANANNLLPGTGPNYWKYLSDYDQVAALKSLPAPALILQGERDYQVTMTDYNLWYTTLSSDPKYTFYTFPGLNHLFMEGKQKSFPAEYLKRGTVHKDVADKIATWIKGL
ncbi:MAG: alpha/beta hydrolase [Bacteroidetes bacterium]|nr:alpha/beta hydrolase [Bacteroidota bacterium]